MPPHSVQQFLTGFEIGLLVLGTFLVFRLLFNPASRRRWLDTNLLPFWPVSLVQFVVFIVLLFTGGFSFQTLMRISLGSLINHAADRSGLEIIIYGTGFHGGALLGWLLFPFIRKYWDADQGHTPVPPPTPVIATPPLSWTKALLYAGGTLLVAMPLLTLLSLGWTYLLKQLGLPDEPQDLIAIFSNTKSPLVITGMLLVACVLAPLNEELIFRGGLYRFCRQRFGRGAALLVSSGLFGAMHGNWAGFLPLAALGALLCLVYEATGSIRIIVIAHGLFNLNTVLVVLSGLSQLP